MPGAAGIGTRASEWCRGLQPRNRNHTGGSPGAPPTSPAPFTNSAGIRIESRSRNPRTSV